MIERVWRVAGIAIACTACGGVTAETPRKVELAAALVAASTANDLAAVRQIVRKPLVVAGLWFADPTCAPFTAAAEVAAPRLPELARCLAGLHLKVAPRLDPLPDVVVMTYGSGIEIEARFLEDDAGPWLSWIGYESRRSAADGLPTVGAATLEAARTSGARDGDLDAATGAALLEHAKAYAQNSEYAWLKLCLDAQGQVTSARMREASSFAAARAFSASASAWTFRPVVVEGQAMPVCAMVDMVYPAHEHPEHEKLPLVLPDATADVMNVPREVLGPRIAGETFIGPDDKVAALIERAKVKEVTAAFSYCLDDAGAVSSLEMVQSSGVPSYDARLASGVRAWRYTPYVEPGHTGHVCSGATFIYRPYRPR